MNRVFADLVFVIVYLDDILIFSKSLDEHHRHVRIVLDILRKKKPIAKCSQMFLLPGQYSFLGPHSGG